MYVMGRQGSPACTGSRAMMALLHLVGSGEQKEASLIKLVARGLRASRDGHPHLQRALACTVAAANDKCVGACGGSPALNFNFNKRNAFGAVIMVVVVIVLITLLHCYCCGCGPPR